MIKTVVTIGAVTLLPGCFGELVEEGAADFAAGLVLESLERGGTTSITGPLGEGGGVASGATASGGATTGSIVVAL